MYRCSILALLPIIRSPRPCRRRGSPDPVRVAHASSSISPDVTVVGSLQRSRSLAVPASRTVGHVLVDNGDGHGRSGDRTTAPGDRHRRRRRQRHRERSRRDRGRSHLARLRRCRGLGTSRGTQGGARTRRVARDAVVEPKRCSRRDTPMWPHQARLATCTNGVMISRSEFRSLAASSNAAPIRVPGSCRARPSSTSLDELEVVVHLPELLHSRQQTCHERNRRRDGGTRRLRAFASFPTSIRRRGPSGLARLERSEGFAPGRSVEVIVPIGPAVERLFVPAAALIMDGPRAHCYAVSGFRVATLRPCRSSIRHETGSNFADGLAEGTSVIVEGMSAFVPARRPHHRRRHR